MLPEFIVTRFTYGSLLHHDSPQGDNEIIIHALLLLFHFAPASHAPASYFSCSCLLISSLPAVLFFLPWRARWQTSPTVQGQEEGEGQELQEPLVNNQTAEIPSDMERVQVVKLVIVVMAAFFLCWSPHQILMYYAIFFTESKVNMGLKLLFLILVLE